MPDDRPVPCRTYEQAADVATGLTRDEILALLGAKKVPPKALMAKYYKTPWFRALKAWHIGGHSSGQQYLKGKGHCMICRATVGLTLHHNTYRRLFAELDGDVLVVCASRCHRRIHGRG